MTFEWQGISYDTSDMIEAEGVYPFRLGVYITHDRKRMFAPVLLPVTGVDVIEVSGEALRLLAESTGNPEIARVWDLHSAAV